MNAPNRAALISIHETLELGMLPADVRNVFTRVRTEGLQLHEARENEWVIKMPLEFGASDWKLLLEFNKERLSAVRLRTSDGPAPLDAPADKVPAKS